MMQYREIGKTGKQASIIGLGCEHLDGKPYAQIKETIDAALAGGVNILDIFMPGQEIRGHIAKALGSKRHEVMIQGHFGSTEVNQKYDISRDMPSVQKYFEDMLRIFDGYIEFGMFFFLDTEKDYQSVFETEFADYAARLKAQGSIGHIGFSSHHPGIARKVIETGLAELMMFSINPAFDMLAYDDYIIRHMENGVVAADLKGIDPTRASLYRLCEQKQIGVTVMKTLGAGKLLSAEHSPFASPLSVSQCIHYALSRPAVASALVGCKTQAEVATALAYLDQDEAQRDYAEVLGSVRSSFRGACVYCSHCQPCPMEIDIAAVNKYLDIARLDTASIPPSVRNGYDALSNGADRCSSCGSCESRCPFGVPVIENMANAAELFTRTV